MAMTVTICEVMSLAKNCLFIRFMRRWADYFVVFFSLEALLSLTFDAKEIQTKAARRLELGVLLDSRNQYENQYENSDPSNTLPTQLNLT